jgi:hypothetical protein
MWSKDLIGHFQAANWKIWMAIKCYSFILLLLLILFGLASLAWPRLRLVSICNCFHIVSRFLDLAQNILKTLWVDRFCLQWDITYFLLCLLDYSIARCFWDPNVFELVFFNFWFGSYRWKLDSNFHLLFE